MPRDPKLVAFAATTDAARATAFYTTVLGLTLRHEDEFASRSRPSNDRQTGRENQKQAAENRQQNCKPIHHATVGAAGFSVGPVRQKSIHARRKNSIAATPNPSGNEISSAHRGKATRPALMTLRS